MSDAALLYSRNYRQLRDDRRGLDSAGRVWQHILEVVLQSNRQYVLPSGQ